MSYLGYPTLLGVLGCLCLATGYQYELYHKSSLPWSQAHEHCMAHSRVLAKVDNPKSQEWVQTLAPYTQTYFWIGLSRQSDRDDFEWVEDGTLPAFTNWADGHPAQGMNCVVMRPQDFKWETQYCSRPVTFLCEDKDYKYSKVVSPETKLTGAMMGVGVFASLLLVSCLILQMPCCRYSVVEKVANLGFGKRDTDTEFLFA